MNKRRIALTLFLAFLSEIANKLVPLVTLHFVAVRLGTAAFGLSQFSFWLLDWGIFLTVYGFSQVGPIMLSKSKSAADQKLVHGSIVFSRLLLATLSSFILILVVQEPSIYSPYKWAVLSSLSILFTSAIDSSWILMARQKMAFWSLLTIFAKIASLVAILMLIHSPDDAVKFVVITNIANSFISICSFFIALKLVGISLPTTNDIRSAFKIATPFALSMMFMMILDRYDLFVVERFLGPVETGIYSAATKLVASIAPILMTITTIFYSEMMAQQDQVSIERHLKASIFWTVSALAPVLVGIWFVDADVLSLVFGPQFAPGARTLSLLLSGVALYGMITIFGFQLLTLKRQWRALVFGLGLGTVIGVGLSLSMIEDWKMTGVAWSGLFGRLICAMIVAHVAIKIWNLNGLNLLRHAMKATIPALMMGLALWGLLLGNIIHSRLNDILVTAVIIYSATFLGLNFKEARDISRKVYDRMKGSSSA